MSEIKDGGPAFPLPQDRMPDGTGISAAEYGMSLRDYFAGQALVGMETWSPCDKRGFVRPDVHAAKAEWAYAMADAMIAQRDKEGAS